MTVIVEFNYWLAIVSYTVQLKSSLEQLKEQFKKFKEGTLFLDFNVCEDMF